MKTVALICLLSLISGYGMTQHKFEVKGDKKMARFSYTQAIEHYRKALSQDAPHPNAIKLKLAECYRMLNKPRKAVRWYSETIYDEKLIEPRHKLHYAQSLCSFGDYTEAEKWLKAYSDDNPNDRRAANYLAFFNQLPALSGKEASCSINNLPINSPTSDFSPAWYGDHGILLVSGRNRYSEKSNRDKSNYLDLYISALDEQGILKEPVKVEGSVNTKAHEGPAAVYDNGTRMIFNRNDHFRGKELKNRGGLQRQQLYLAEREGNFQKARWTNVVPFPFNSREYSCSHPTVSSDGKTLYFISDMPGGFGGTDIYRSIRNGLTWGVPENLGPEVNTEGDEMYPFISGNDKLYFASDGQGGFGGLDLFMAEINEESEFSDVRNLGLPINSKSDDFGIIVRKSGLSGYFSSNREGNDDIYRFEAANDSIQ